MTNKKLANIQSKSIRRLLQELMSKTRVHTHSIERIHTLATGILNRLRITPRDSDLVGLISHAVDKNNRQAINSWLIELSESGELFEVESRTDPMQFLNVLVSKLESSIQDVHLFSDH